MKTLMHEMSWVEVQQALKVTDTVIVPLGALEEHGPHDPVGSCFILANESSRLVGVRTGAPVTPTIPFGVSKSFENFPGTITVRSGILKEYVKEVCRNLIRHGFKRIIFFSAHGGGNLHVLSELAEELREENGTLFAVLHIWGLIGQLSSSVTPAPNVRGAHGGEPVASVMLHLTPNLVDMSKAKWTGLKQPLEGMKSVSYGVHEFEKLKVAIPLRTEEVAEDGVMGDPTKASNEWGEKLFNAVIDYLVDFVEHFKRMKIPEATKARSDL